jgi:hypothetical protein
MPDLPRYGTRQGIRADCAAGPDWRAGAHCTRCAGMGCVAVEMPAVRMHRTRACTGRRREVSKWSISPCLNILAARCVRTSASWRCWPSLRSAWRRSSASRRLNGECASARRARGRPKKEAGPRGVWPRCVAAPWARQPLDDRTGPGVQRVCPGGRIFLGGLAAGESLPPLGFHRHTLAGSGHAELAAQPP